MKRLTLSLGLCLLSFSALFGQQTVDAANTRDGEHVEYCVTHKKLAELMNNPAFAAQYAQDQAAMAQAASANSTPTRGTIYKIPVVFHVLHNGGIENISREQIEDAVAILNRDYRLQNADANNVHPDFSLSNPNATCVPTDVEIEFVLATKAPNGACFGGITRTLSAMSYEGDDGSGQVDAIVDGNDVYQGEWPGNRYLNIFVCGNIGGAAGYTFNPSNWIGTNMRNGVWILHNYTGSIGTGGVNTSRALTHEVGHWLNLSHTWGPNNNPGNASSCSDDDDVTDTPNCIGVTSCNLNDMSCGPRANVENYMDYSYCSKMFSAGQVARMRASLTGNTGGRNNLWTVSNLTATGTNGNATLCSANFSTVKTEICSGESITFTDESYNVVTGWSWSFPGGTPSTSTSENPVVTYTTPGVYNVTLSATDGSTTLNVSKSAFITVYAPGESLPFFEGFEDLNSTTNFDGSPRWKVNDLGTNNKWAVTSTAAHSGTNSAKLTNFGQAAGNIDELISSPVDLSQTVDSIGVTLSFRYAYRKRATANDDYLKVFVSNNCGDNWDQRKTMHGATLSNATATTTWTPTAADWGTVHMTNVTSQYWVNNFRFKFRFESDGGNNIYLDDINIYSGPPSDEPVLAGIAENAQFQQAIVFPNPTDGDVNLRFNALSGQTATVLVTDLLGHTVQRHTIQANQGDNTVMLSTANLSSGMYLIRLSEAASSQTLQFMVK